MGRERIAPVTWLFGEPAAGADQAATAGRPGPASPPAAPREGATTGARSRGSFAPVSNVSMHALARRGVSVHELRDLLLSRDFDEQEVEGELERLGSVGLLDDSQLAETLVRTLRERKGLGRTALLAELRRRKLSAEAIESALSGLGDDETDRAIELAQRRAPQLRSLDEATARRRLGAFLMRKGYSGSVVATAVERALQPAGPRFR